MILVVKMIGEGNFRLWIVSSVVWIFIAGWFFWPKLPSTPTASDIDMGNFSNELCSEQLTVEDMVKATRNEQAEKAHHSVTINTPTGHLIIPELTPAEDPEIYQKRLSDCMFSEKTLLAFDKALDARLKRVTQEASSNRIKLLEIWVAEMLLPPITLPLMILGGLFLYRWVLSGYRRGN